MPKRERHVRHLQRPAAYGAIVVLAFSAAAFGTFALWRAETPPPAAVCR